MYRPILNCCRPQNTICGEGEEEEGGGEEEGGEEEEEEGEEEGKVWSA